MNMKAYAFHRETREFLGEVELNDSDKCPMTGAWLIPGDCLEAPPPNPPSGMRVVEQGGVWRLVKNPQPAPEPELLAPVAAPVAAVPTSEQVQAYMDATARAHGYFSLESAISYADEMAVPKFGGDGRAFRAWRSRVWAKFFELDPSLTIEEVLPLLPVLDIKAEESWVAAMEVALAVQAAAAAAKAQESVKDEPQASAPAEAPAVAQEPKASNKRKKA